MDDSQTVAEGMSQYGSGFSCAALQLKMLVAPDRLSVFPIRHTFECVGGRHGHIEINGYSVPTIEIELGVEGSFPFKSV